jgi:hypothetical protein
MYIYKTINSFDELIEEIDSNSIELYLDTNLCIYLRDFYKEPSSIIKRADIWSELRDLLKNIETNDIIVDYSIGTEEACRNKSDFLINYEKQNDMSQSINALFNMKYFEILEHSKLIKFDEKIKDITQKDVTKINSLEAISIFQNSLFVNYACLLKMYLLDMRKTEVNRVQLMIEFLDFLEKEVDLFSTSIVVFAHYFFSGNTSIRKIIHKSKNVSEEKIHALWNAAIDLVLPTYVSKHLIESKLVPVFATADEALWLVYDSMKIRVTISDGNKFAHPPVVEADLSNTLWSDEELWLINTYYQKISERRRYKFVFDNFDQEKLLQNLRIVCKSLEDELKSVI